MKTLPFYLLLLSSFLFHQCNSDENKKVYHISSSMQVDGFNRTYLVNLPPSYYASPDSFALVIALHGTGGSASQFESDYHFSDKANAAGFIAVYPDGVPSDGILHIRTWNAGSCCDYAMQNNIDDVKFISQLIDKTISAYHINPKKVYVTGMSNGGMLAYRLACELSDKIAAIAPVSSTLMTTQPCVLDRAMPVLHIHSAQDTKVPYYGGPGLMGYYFHPVDSTLAVMSAQNVCNQTRIIIDDDRYKHTEWSSCAKAITMECYLTTDGGHAWPGGEKVRSAADTPSTMINANDVIWDFFQRYQLP